ncbi:MAG: glycosyltransferase family 1 protein [Bacteroidales bacterium]|nr:glycosyltransferase family 1 protein [Bacteroidales bacterium]MDD4670769.1 glycosyltransferase family 1 protein [Bacteroidales bacterium]
MKGLFIIFHGFEEYNGISKKIRYQIAALKECGAEMSSCYYIVDENNHRKIIFDEAVLADLGRGKLGAIRKRICYKPILRCLREGNYDFVYCRSYHNANPFTISLFRGIKKAGIKSAMEIPTYPYDSEYITFRMKCDLFVDRCFRHKLAGMFDYIVTFSNDDTIFGQKTIRISNGIDFSAIKIKEHLNDTSSSISLIGVAEVHYWHGFDRIIRGMVDYYKSNPDYKVYFHIIGNLTGEREKQEILVPIAEHYLEEYVTLHGPLYGAELDEVFENADFGVGSLGRHRSGIKYIKPLKNREYTARGIPFIFSETDEDFENMPFVMKAAADDSPIHIPDLINFYKSVNMSPAQIRNSISDLSWRHQMQIVLDKLFNKDDNGK